MQFLRDIPLVKIDHKFLLHEGIVSDYLRLQQAASNAGISLDIVSSYRDVARQVHIWDQKWLGKRPLFDRAGKRLNPIALSSKEKLKAILVWSALPGASRHHWGTDMDVYDAPAVTATGNDLQLVVEEYQFGGPCHRLNQWLSDNIESHGFYRPYNADIGGVAMEPWHISHKTQSEACSALVTQDALAQLIKDLDIQGKSVILENMDWIYPQFVLNLGVT